jgi:hypothetical protein
MQSLRISQPNIAYRRLAGLLLGGTVGLGYGMVSQGINRLILPGVPLYQPPYNATGNAIACLAGGALLGLICSWPQGSVQGTFLASAVSALAIVIGSFISAGMTRQVLVTAAVTGIFLALPFWGMLVPVLAALRWAVDHLEESHRDRLHWGLRVVRSVLLILIAGLIGLHTRYPAEARRLLIDTHAWLQQAQQVTAEPGLPAWLAAPDVGGFVQRGRGSYELSWEKRDLERYRIPRPGRNFNNHSAVIAHFAGGWNLVCIYITAEEPPLCKGFDHLPS